MLINDSSWLFKKKKMNKKHKLIDSYFSGKLRNYINGFQVLVSFQRQCDADDIFKWKYQDHGL